MPEASWSSGCEGIGKQMKKDVKRKLTLDHPVTYQVKVPCHLDVSWAQWAEGMTITVECQPDESPVTTLTGVFDQAALQSLLRRLYSLGIPLVSVTWIDVIP